MRKVGEIAEALAVLRSDRKMTTAPDSGAV